MKTWKNCNPVMMNALPLRRSVKDAYLRRYSRLIRENGLEYANSYFKRLRLAIMRYVSGEWSEEIFVAQMRVERVKVDKHLRYLMVAAKSHPHTVISFLKFPTGNPANKGSAERTYLDLIEELGADAPKSHQEVEKLLVATIAFLKEEGRRPDRRPGLADAFAPASPRKQRRLKLMIARTRGNYVHPADYKDSEQDESGVWVSPGFEKDWVASKNNHIISIDENTPVGEIHLVAKGTDDFRAVAAPNRFLQQRLAPAAEFLTWLTESVRTDATFNQGRHDGQIQKWVDSDDITPYGVDIHHATNTLPFRHGRFLCESLMAVHRDSLEGFFDVKTLTFGEDLIPIQGVWQWLSKTVTPVESKRYLVNEVAESWRSFLRMTSAPWDTPYGEVRFRTGQPLGTWPSFRVLNLQNMFYAEAAIFWLLPKLKADLQQETDPTRKKHLVNLIWDLQTNLQYAVLGDDVVFKHRIVAEVYIQILNRIGVPLSLHKSFRGKLVEFAGKVFVKGHAARYITDHNVITRENVFEWSQATGHPLRWSHLPVGVQKSLTQPGFLAAMQRSLDQGHHGVREQVTAWSIPGAFNSLSRALCESSGTPGEAASYSYEDFNSYLDMILEARQELAGREPEPWKGDGIPVRCLGETEIYSPQARAHLEAMPVRKTVKSHAGRPAWKDSKFKTDTTAVLLSSAVAALRWRRRSRQHK